MRPSLAIIILLTGTLLAVACTDQAPHENAPRGQPAGEDGKQAPPPPGPAPDQAGGSAPGGQPGAAGDAPESEGEGEQLPQPSERLVGSWAMELTPTQQRQFELLQMAFRDPPPTREELAQLDLSSDESLMIGMVLMGREQHPDDHALPDVHKSLDELSSATLVATGDQLTFSYGQESDVASYSVLEQAESSLILETVSNTDGQRVVEKVQVSFEGGDLLTLQVEGDLEASQQSFTRRRDPAQTP